MRSIEKKDNFMQPYVYQGTVYQTVNAADECMLVPKDDYEAEMGDIETIYDDVFYGRLSANGYMDCTDWVIGDSVEDVLNKLEEYYGAE